MHIHCDDIGEVIGSWRFAALSLPRYTLTQSVFLSITVPVAVSALEPTKSFCSNNLLKCCCEPPRHAFKKKSALAPGFNRSIDPIRD